jgi:hypothetical protein
MKQKIELHLGLPNFGGMLHAPFVRSLLNCQQNGVPRFANITFIDGDSLVSRARNNCVEQFLAGPHTHLVFIDTDIEFTPEHVDTLVGHLQRGVTIVSGLYPKKQDALEWVVNGIEGEDPDEHGLTKIKYAGTGFLAIAREVFIDMMAGPCRHMWAWSDNGQGARRRIYDFFPVGNYTFPDGNRRYLSEDWFFCELAMASGHTIYCDTSIKTKHIGKKVYQEEVAK